ncbi:MAG: hypothetical protein F6K24_32670 [Okeania sp. SIO2D1]|nr:hypothetical protein [Okeania sp. SIO2D1]
MATSTLFLNAPDITPDDYCVFGLATCFVREDGEVHRVEVIEPIPSSALEALLKGIPTSYKFACAKSLGEIFSNDQPQIPDDFPQEAQLCDNFTERVIAGCRTYKSRQEAKTHIPLGTRRDDFNYSVEKKRLLNVSRVVTKDDNVKQHAHTHKVL